MVPHEFEALDHDQSNSSMDQLQALYAQQSLTHHLPQILKNEDSSQSPQSYKFIAFLIVMLIGVIWIVTVELKTSDSPEDNPSFLPKNDTNTFTGDDKGGSILNAQSVGQKMQLLQNKIKDLEAQIMAQSGDGLISKKAHDVRLILTEFKLLRIAIQTSQKAIEMENIQNKKQINQLKAKVQELSGKNNRLNFKKSPLLDNHQKEFRNNQQPGIKNHKLAGLNIFQGINQVDQSYQFEIPKILWLYQENPSNFLGRLIYRNIRYYAKKSGFDTVVVNALSYKHHLSNSAWENAHKVISTLNQRLQSKDSGNLNHHIQQITQQVILLSILSQKGGIITSGSFAMTEDFSWIKNIIKNQYAIRGNRGAKPQVVGFYSPYYSPEKTRENIKPFPGMNEVDKWITLYPSMENYFIAADKNTQFILQVVKKISSILLDPQKAKVAITTYILRNLKGQDINYEYFLIAVQTILQDKQNQLSSNTHASFKHFAVDYYGLYLINCLYAPYKLKNFWQDQKEAKIFQNLAQYTQEQFQENVGPMRYIVRLTPQSTMNQYLQDAKQGRTKLIVKGSFLQRLFFPQEDDPILTNNVEIVENRPSSAQKWDSLPKTIWVFWDKGVANARISNQLCVQNLKKMGALSGFQVIQVNMTNANQYLDDSTLKKINYTLEHAKLKTYPQSQGDLIRLALLSKHGGIYMDASYLALESFDWLIDIAKYPSQYIFNRFGSLPKVFMFWHPHYGSPFQWTINQRYNTKSQWHLSYQNNFIAAQKGSNLITDWFELLLSLYQKSYNQVQIIFQNCNTYGDKWIKFSDHYLLAMDAIKCVLGQREKSLKGQEKWEQASDYYKIWSMSGYLGQQKLRSNTNYQNSESQDNLFVYRYSQEYVEGIIGKIHHVTKFYSLHNNEISDFIERHKDGNFTLDAHPQSIFMKYMWNPKYKMQGTRQIKLRVEP